MVLASKHTSKVEYIVSRAKELERYCLVQEVYDLAIPATLCEEMMTRCREIETECDTVALPRRAHQAATAVADAAHLIAETLGHATSTTVTSAIAGQYGSVEQSELGYKIDPERYQHAVNYVVRAIELLKYPSEYYKADDSGLYIEGGFYL